MRIFKSRVPFVLMTLLICIELPADIREASVALSNFEYKLAVTMNFRSNKNSLLLQKRLLKSRNVAIALLLYT